MTRSPSSACRRLLVAAIRAAEPDGTQLRELLIANPAEYAALLGINTLGEWLNDREDVLATRLASFLRERDACSMRAQASKRQARTATAAQQLRSTAERHHDELHVDVALLLGPLLAAKAVRFFVFECGESEVTLGRAALRKISRLVRFSDRRAWFDRRGLHVRWRGGRGGLDLKSQRIPRNVERSVMRVPLHPVVPLRRVVPAGAAMSTAGDVMRTPIAGRAWLADALLELALP